MNNNNLNIYIYIYKLGWSNFFFHKHILIVYIYKSNNIIEINFKKKKMSCSQATFVMN